jgi:soluble lytic murein transglycosylase-like protein
MKRFGILLLSLLWLLPNCGGKKQVVSEPPKQPAVAEEQLALDLEDDKDEALAGSVNSQRLEELYSKASVAGLEETTNQEMKKWEMQKGFDMPIQVNKEVRNYIYYFSTDRKDLFSRYLSRSTRYLPMIKKVFAEYGLPEDLAYLAMIESGYSNKARSSASAVGMWQFMKGTGLRYGLTIDGAVDERRDPEKATHAAAKYLSDLYKQFGSWYLAAASYNCGEGRVQKEINRNVDLKNFWELSNNYCLPNETKNYVPQMIAATIIAKNPTKYGFKNIPYQQPLKYDVMKVNESTSLQAAAMAATTNYEEISALNPELLRDVTPGGAYPLKIPPGKKETFGKNIEMARIQFPAWGARAYASREDTGGAAAYTAPSRRSTRSYREYAVSYGPKPKSKTELQTRAAKSYDELPKLSANGRNTARNDRAKGKQELQVAHAQPPGREYPRAGTKEAPRRSGKSEQMEGPVTAGMIPGLTSAKKAKKETATVAKKSSENATGTKKCNDNSKNKKKKKEE